MNRLTSESHPPANASEAFGELAVSYDRDFETLPASRRLRQTIWDTYLRYFHRGESLLELNCGTGTDAMALAHHGIRIHATDISSGMLQQFHEKLSTSSVKELVTTQQLSFDQLDRLQNRTFDGAYSNMGGLNCAPDLQLIARNLGRLIKPGGFFIGTFLGTVPLWEMSAFLLRGNVRSAFRRREGRGVPAHVGSSMIQTYYYSPRTVRAAFRDFAPIELAGLNIFTPPPTSQSAYRIFGKGMRILEHVDDILMRHLPFSTLGDHFLIVLKKSTS